MDPLYTVGQWWLPESPYVRVAGELQFSPKDGVTLNLVGDPLGRGKDHDESSYPVVYGIIAGAEVTIMKELGHFPMSENPAQFRRYIMPVLEKIRAAAGQEASNR